MQLIGKLTLNRNPTNYFAETEQVAFHTGNLVPGIEVTNDPLMQARLFSYLDTQLTRLGGPNFTQLPINRPHCPVNDMLRDGMHQTAIHTGLAPYRPNSIDDGEPLVADDEHGGYVQTPRARRGSRRCAAQPASFDDHFTQPAMFYRSLTPLEQAHVVEAFTFELGKCYEQAIKERELQVLANVDADLCEQVAAGLGLPAPKGNPPTGRRRCRPRCPRSSPTPGPIDGRKVGIIADAGSDLAGIETLRTGLQAVGVTAAGDRTGRSASLSNGGRRSSIDRPWPPHGRSSSTRSSSPAERPRATTSNSSCCCRRHSGTARRSARGVTAQPPCRGRESVTKTQAFWLETPLTTISSVTW